MAFRNLSARISGDATSYVSATRRAKRAASGFGREATSLSAKLQILQGRADEAGEEIAGAGRDAAVASTSFTALSFSTDGLALSFGTLSTALTASLIPALAVLSTVLVPIAATLGVVAVAAGGLAAAFGTVIGTGLIAFGQKRGEQNEERLQQLQSRIASMEDLKERTGGLNEVQQEHLDNLRQQASELEDQTGIMGGLQSAIGELMDEIRPMIVAFGQQFIPLIEDAFDAIPQLVQNILDSLGGMGAFEQALYDAGNAAMTAIPNIVAALFDLARDALPALRNMAVWLLENGDEIWQGMVETAVEVGPMLMDLGQTAADLVPKINELGIEVLDVLVPAFAGLAEVLGPAISMIEWVVDTFNNAPNWAQTAVIYGLATAAAAVVSPFASLGGLLVGIVATLTQLRIIVDLVAEGIWILNDAIKAVAMWIYEIAEPAIDAFGDAISTALSPIDDALAALGDLVGSAWEIAVDFVGGALDVAGEILSRLQEIASKTWNTVVDIAMTLTDPITGPPGKLESGIQSWMAGFDPRNWEGGEGLDVSEQLNDALAQAQINETSGSGANVTINNMDLRGQENPRQAGREAVEGIRDALKGANIIDTHI